MNPAVSVIVPVHDRAELMRLALQSALAQTWRDFEVVVVNDASTEDIPGVLSSLDSDRVRYFEGTYGNPALARNAALAEMRGRYAAFLDSDDLWEPEKLERQMAAMEARPDAGMAVCNFMLIDINGAVTRERYIPADHRPSGDALNDFLAGELPIATSGVVVTKKALDATGVFENYPAGEDFDLWLRLAAAYPVVYQPECLARYRIHSEGLTNHDMSRFWAAAGDVTARRRGLLEARGIGFRKHAARFYALAARSAREESKSPALSRRYFFRALTYDPLCLGAYKGVVKSFF